MLKSVKVSTLGMVELLEMVSVSTDVVALAVHFGNFVFASLVELFGLLSLSIVVQEDVGLLKIDLGDSWVALEFVLTVEDELREYSLF